MLGSKNLQGASKRLLGAEERNLLGVPRKVEKKKGPDPMERAPERNGRSGNGGGGPLKDPQKRAGKHDGKRSEMVFSHRTEWTLHS